VLIRWGRFSARPRDARIYFLGKVRRPMRLRVRPHHWPAFRFRLRYFCCCVALGADVARRMRRLVGLERWMQSREIGFAGLVCGGRALRGRGAGNKPGHRDGQRRDANKTKARHNSSAAPDRCCAAHADDANSHQTNRVACIGHSRGDDMVAQLRIFWCKAQTKVSIKVNVLAPERSGSRCRDLSSTR
jgi:hypothetical protein